jgi:Bacterial SH3 domain
MRSTDKDMGKGKTNHPAVPTRWSVLKFISVFLLSVLILACSHMPPQEGRGTAQARPVPESEKNLSKETKVKDGATVSSPNDPSTPTLKQTPPPPVKAQDPAKAAPLAAEAKQKPALSSPSSTSLPTPLRVTEVAWATVNLREGPGMNHKVIGTAKKGTRLQVFEDKGGWLRAGLDDGKEVWVSKSATPEAPKTSSPPASSPPPNPSSSSLKRTPSKPASPM